MMGNEVPDEASKCPICGRCFPNEHIRRLHEGRDHFEILPPERQSAVRDAHERETEVLRRFQLQALLALVCLYFGILLTYAIFA